MLFLNWITLGVNIVIDTTGNFLTYKLLKNYLICKIKKVLITNLPKDKNIPIFIMNFNNKTYLGQNIISNASYIITCLIFILKNINDRFYIYKINISIFHSFIISFFKNSLLNNFKNNTFFSKNLIKFIYKLIPDIKGKIISFSFFSILMDTPYIDLNIFLEKHVIYKNIFNIIKEVLNLINFNNNLFLNNKFSINVNNNFIKVIIFCDNNVNYFNKLFDLIKYIFYN